MTEIDEMTQQLNRSAVHALRAARLAVDRYRQRTSRQRDEARREREHRLRVFETKLRTTVLQRQLAAKEGNDRLAAELTDIERDQRTGELIARWAASEAHRAGDPQLADAWTARLREAGIDPERVRAQADELVGEPVDYTDLTGTQQLAADHADMTSDFAERHAQTPVENTGLDEGAETARLIDTAHPADVPVGSVSTTAQALPTPHVVDLEHVAGL